MNTCFWRFVLVAGTAVLLTACGNKETKEALDKASALEAQKQYQDANHALVDAVHAREAELKTEAGSPTDQAAIDALVKKAKADPEILKMERAQVRIYLDLERADLASVVYADILAGNPGDTVVFDLLHDKETVIRNGAVRILGLAGTADAIDALAAATKDADQEVRRSAVVALGAIKDPKSNPPQMDPRVVPPLIAALKDAYWDVRSEAANALGQSHQGSAVKPLLDAVTDSDSTVETSAETALLFLSKAPDGPGKAAAAPDDFVARLNDPNPKIVLISAVCLASLKDARAIPYLVKLTTSPDRTTRLDAVRGLGEVGDPSVIPTLRQTLKDPDVYMRGWSIIGLGTMKDEGSLPDLRAIAADPAEPDKIKAAANDAINHIAPSTAPATTTNQ